MHRLLRYFATLLLFTLSTYATVNCQQTQNVQSFVQRFYVTILEREPDVGGLDDWTNKLIAHERTGATLAEGFIFSPEYTARHTDNASYLRTLYRAFFNREADAEGWAYWLEALTSQKKSRKEVLYGFTHSVEFINLSNQYGIEAYAGHGIGVNLAGLDAFVTGFYETLLGRTPASTEVAYWTQKLSSGNATGADIAKGFVFSAEYDERSKEDNTFLTDLYKTFFHRSPDEGGMVFWKKALTEGMSREVLLTKFLHSKEFETLAKSYGIKAYEGATLPTAVHTQNTNTNTPPQANAGADQSTEQGTEVTLDGSSSQDSDGTIACYWWREGANILSTHAQYTLETNTLALGRHTLLLSVADDKGVVATDAVRVEVKDANGNSNGAGANAGNSPNTTGSNVGGSASTGGANTDDTDSGTQSEDVTPPIITLNGESNITLEQNAVYTELGARAVDAVDGNLTVSISGVVDTSTVGEYTLTYTATDSAGNVVSVKRNIKIVNKNPITALTLTADKTNVVRTKFGKEYGVVVVEAKVMASYADGHSQEVTDKVTWQGFSGKVAKSNGKIVFYEENNLTIKASYLDKQSNPLTLTVQNAENTGASIYVTIYNEMSERFPKRGAGIMIELLKEPKEDVLLTVRLQSNDKVGFEGSTTLSKTLHFKAGEGWDRAQAVTVIDNDVNNTQPYTVYTDTFESNDSAYAGIDPKDIVVTPHASIEFIEPPLRKRKGAIRGVRVHILLYAKSGNVETFRLVNPPKGMSLESPPLHTINEFNDMSRSATDIVWDVPMDIEEKTYNITVEATDTRGKKGRITFPIKVPKTKPIQTKIENNELIVTDKSSNLYGMKMKGHKGEDISGLRLRSVKYEDVWKKGVKKESPEDIVERTVFVIDNMPEALDVKMPEYMDSIEKVLKIGARFLKNNESLTFGSFWKGAVEKWDESKGSLSVIYENETFISSRIFLISIDKSQKIGK